MIKIKEENVRPFHKWPNLISSKVVVVCNQLICLLLYRLNYRCINDIIIWMTFDSRDKKGFVAKKTTNNMFTTNEIIICVVFCYNLYAFQWIKLWIKNVIKNIFIAFMYGFSGEMIVGSYRLKLSHRVCCQTYLAYNGLAFGLTQHYLS